MTACSGHPSITASRLATALSFIALSASQQPARAEIDFEPTWQLPHYAHVRELVDEWVDEVQPTNEVTERIDELWPEASDDEGADATAEQELLDRLAETIAAVDKRAAELVRLCRADYAGPELPDASWLAEGDVPPLARDNLRLYYARWLAQHKLYDETIAELKGLSPADVVDPASLLFYRMIAYQQLVQPDEARAALVQLMEHRDQLPRRYQQLGQLLERDLESLDDESLDHIARRMNDIRRRLAYGRAGEHVQEIERGVVESLDRTIKELEEKQQQSQQSQASGPSQPGQPMQDSRLAPMQAPMEVDQRDIGHSSGWGDLPPKEREQALQAIGRDFPAHYRDLIEQYFRELAAEPTSPPN
jgi:hypothetical protein